MNKIRQGDDVLVIAGKDKGRRGTVTRVLDNGKLLIEGVNIAKKHVRPNPNQGVAGGIVDKEMPIQASNVKLWNPQIDKGDRVGFKFIGEGEERRKVRIFRATGEVVDI